MQHQNQHQNKNRSMKFSFIIICITILVYLTTLKVQTNSDDIIPVFSNSTNFVETGISTNFGYNSGAVFYSYNSHDYYFCTNDGMKYITGNGETKWNEVFTMNMPNIVSNCSYVAAYEPRGSIFYVFSPEGLLYKEEVDGIIQDISINSEGYVSIIVRSGDDYITTPYNKKGVKVNGFLHRTENIIPFASSVSTDGRIWAVNVLDINGMKMASNIIFYYNKREENKNHTDGIFGGIPKENQIIALLQFFDDNNLISVSDSEISHIPFKEDVPVSISKSIELDNKIDFMGYMGNKGFVIALGDGNINKESKPQGTVQFYDKTASKIGEYNFGKKITYLYANENYAIVGSNRHYVALNTKGHVIWEYNALQDYKQIVLLESTDVVLFVTNNEAKVMRRSNRSNEKKQSPTKAPSSPTPTSLELEPIEEEAIKTESFETEAVETE